MADDFINALGATQSSGPPEGQRGGGTDAGSTADLLRNEVLSGILTALQAAFPQATASISASATGGAATLPANPVSFLTITVGATAYKIPLYNV